MIGGVGANGAGKTTLLRLLAGDLRLWQARCPDHRRMRSSAGFPRNISVPGETVGIRCRAGCTAAQEAMNYRGCRPARQSGHDSRAGDPPMSMRRPWMASPPVPPTSRTGSPWSLARLGFATDDPESLLMTGLRRAGPLASGWLPCCARGSTSPFDGQTTNGLDLDGLACSKRWSRVCVAASCSSATTGSFSLAA